ncbi:MAG: anthrone oxygenase family protein [Pseudonocardiaceae bacterium]
MLQILVPLVVFANGLAAGVLVGTQLGGWPLLAALPPQRYVQAHAFFSTRYDPFMPICLLGTVLGDLLLLLPAPGGAARTLLAVAAGCAAGTVAISIGKNVPVNRWVRALDPDRLPDDFAAQDPRRRWGAWNRTRTWLAVLALLANCAALATLL